MPEEIMEQIDTSKPDNYQFIGDVQQKTIQAQNTGNPAQDVATIAKQLEEAYNAPPLGTKKPQSPTYTAYKDQLSIDSLTKPQYSEEAKVQDAFNQINPENVFINKMSNMYKQTPEERAVIGSKLGGVLGLASGGVVGSIIGANIGAMAARAAGQIQTGELEDANRRSKMYDTFNTMGIASDNKISFDDGTSFYLTNDPSIKLPNISSMVTGQKNRTPYEIDASNPLSNRASAVAKPLSYMLSAGLMRWNNLKDSKDAKALDSTNGTLVNAFLENTDNINTVYSRARQVADKAGISKMDMLSYFKGMEGKISDSEMQTILKAIEIIYA